MQPSMQTPRQTLTLLGAIAACSTPALAQHADIAVTVVDGAIATATAGAEAPIPTRVFSATFGDTGVARFTSNPGFDALPGTFAAGTRTGFTPRTGLRKYESSALTPVTTEELEIKFLTLATVVGAEPSPGFDLAVQSNGGWHRHLSFTLRSSGAKLPPSGLYVAELELYSTDGVTLPSAPFWIVFNDGRPEADVEEAMAWVTANLAQGDSPCPGDLNGDGEAGAADLATLLSAWGTPAADLTDDGETNAADIAVLLSNWGACR
jgi:hypothetical protein